MTPIVPTARSLSRTRSICAICVICGCFLAPFPARAQVATGTPPFGSFSGGPDIVNNANLNVHWAIPVLTKAGRGMPFYYILTFDSSVWYPVGASGSQVWTPVSNWGWAGITEVATGYVVYQTYPEQCAYGSYPNLQYYYWTIWQNFVYYDNLGIGHSMPVAVSDWNNGPCGGGPPSTMTGTTTDGSGYKITASSGPSATMYARSGATINAPLLSGTGSGTVTDPNGNQVSASYASGTTSFYDTLSSTTPVLTAASNSTSNTFTYTGGSGTPAQVVMNYSPYTVQTNFGCTSPAVGEYTASNVSLVTEIDLPDDNPNGVRDRYTFTYEVTPGDSHSPHYVTGRIQTVTLPSGGTISYSYSGGSNGITCSDGSTATLTRTTPDGTWSYAHSESGSAWTTTLTDPQSNTTTFNFQGIYETERQVYQGSATQLLDVTTCYNNSPSSCTRGSSNTSTITLPITERVALATPYSSGSPGSAAEVLQTYDGTYTLPLETDEYDFGASTPTRKTIVAYDYNTSCGVTNTAVVNRPCTVTVENASGGTVASTSNTYNGNGNLTQTTSGGLTRNFTYNSNGTMATSADARGTTTYGYGSNSCSAFPDTVTPPISSLATSGVWNCNGAVPTSLTDPNGQAMSFGYDNMNRRTSTGSPDGGSVTIAYSPTQIQTTMKITPSVSRTNTVNLDGQGRVSSQTAASVTANTTYDSLGRVGSVSISNSGAQDSYQYDALNRVTRVTHADSTYAQTSYSNNCATTTDEAGKARQVCVDGLGRVNNVTEDPSPGLNYVTSYAYNPLNDLTGVTQGSQSRSYQYDSLGRVTQATVPESGTTYFTYDSDSTCGTSAGDLVKRVDARGTRTCYAYDAIHRLTQKSYSDGTATANYYNDQTSYNGLTINNGKGRRTGMSDGSGATAWNYDAMGRALTEAKTIAGIPRTMGAAYNYDGSLASLTYPSGRAVTYGIDSLGRPQSAVDSANGINYALNATYAAQGALASVVNGQTGTFGGITYSLGYNNRLWQSSISASSSNGTALSLSYSYFANGTVNVITNNRDNGRTVTYGYDSLNRISSASTQAASGADCWGQAVPSTGYDRYANLLTINVTKCSAPSLSISVNGNNQVTGFSYDVAGDVINDGSYTYSWDAEGRMTAAGSTTYAYDGDGQRVKKSTGTLYWRGADGSVLAETDTLGNTLNEYIFFGARIARRDSSGNVFYYFGSALGSATITNSSGSLCYDADFYPFGGELAFTNTCGQSYKFAGMEQDSETGDYHTWFRQYNPNQGRWLSPDPLAGDVSNPQSLNRYAYVLNNPTNLTDPKGLCTAEQIRDNNCDGVPPLSHFTDTLDGGCYFGEVQADCALVQGALQAGFAVQCPNNQCTTVGTDPYNGQQAVLQFTASGDAAGYLSAYDWSQGVNAVNGTFLSNDAFQAYVRGNFLDAINTQLAAVIDALEKKGASSDQIKAFVNYLSENFTQIVVNGGNADFATSGKGFDFFSQFASACPSERCDLGGLGTLDFSHNDGTFHLDTADPYSGFVGLATHFGVDLFLGNVAYVVIPRH